MLYDLVSSPRFLNQLPIGNGLLLHGTLEKPVEQHPSVFCRSSVEPKRKFVEIVVQMLMADSPLMRSQQPPFQQRGDSVTRGQQTVPHIRAFAHQFMRVSEALQLTVSNPSISSDHRSWVRRFLHGSFQTGGRGVRNTAKPDSSDAIVIHLYRNHYQCLSGGTPSTLAAFFSTDIGLIHLDDSDQPIPSGNDHGAPQCVQPCPRRPITTQSQNTLDSQGTRAIFLSGDPPNRSKPHRQRFVRPMENRSGHHRDLIITLRTLQQHRAYRSCLWMPTSRTTKSFRPAQLTEIIPTGFFRRESRLQFRKRLWISVHRKRILQMGVT